MRVLITGAKGVLGSALVQVVEEAGLESLSLDQDALDITDPHAVHRVLTGARPASVVNCAAYSNVDGAQSEPKEALQVNRDGAAYLAAAAVEVGAHFVHLSTDYVFNGSKTTPYLPTDQPAPLNLYGISKLAGEAAVREVNPDALVLRTSWIFGEGGRGFVAWARGALAEDGPPLRVVEDERSRPTHSQELAKGILGLVEKDARGCMHLANQGDCTRLELAQEIRRILGSGRGLAGVSSESFGAPARRPAYSVLDLSDAEEALGRALPHWTDSLRRYLTE